MTETVDQRFTGDPPDTLVLEDRVALARNALLGYVDERNDDIPFMFADLTSDPASLSHSRWDYGSSVGRLVSALVITNELTDTGATETTDRLKTKLMSFFRDDGLNYREASEFTEARANLHDQRSVLLGLLAWHLESGETAPKAAASDLCEGLREISLKSESHWYVPAPDYAGDRWPSQDTVAMSMSVDAAHTTARMIKPLLQFHDITGSRVALELAENYTRQLVDDSGAFNEDGSFNDGREFRHGHFHSRTVSAAGVARYAAYTGDYSYLDWVGDVYDWVRSQGVEFGWFPGGLKKNKVYAHETCALTDVIEMAIVLAKHGYPSRWDDVERFVRNHLVETQVTDVEAVADASDRSANDETVIHDDVGERSLGAFAGWASPNDFVCDVCRDWDVMTCCIAAGVRGLYLASQNVVTHEPTHVAVNLLFNRSTPTIDVHSHLPHDGRVDIHAKESVEDLRVRIPPWVNRARLDVDGTDRPDTWWKEPYVDLGAVPAETTVTLSFPVRHVTTTETAVDEEYTVEWVGDTVVDIDPTGEHWPLYTDRDVLESAPLRDDPLPERGALSYW